MRGINRLARGDYQRATWALWEDGEALVSLDEVEAGIGASIEF